MAQPAPKLQGKPTVTIRIQNGIPDQDSVEIQIGQLVEFHNEDNTPYEIPLAYVANGPLESYPLAAHLPAGGKCGLIGMSLSTCQYTVYTYSGGAATSDDRVGGGPPYTIVVGPGEPEGN